MSRPEAHRLDGVVDRVFLGGLLSSSACNSVARKSTIFQRTVTVSLCGCLSLGVHTIVLLVAAKLFVPVLHKADLRLQKPPFSAHAERRLQARQAHGFLCGRQPGGVRDPAGRGGAGARLADSTAGSVAG